MGTRGTLGVQGIGYKGTRGIVGEQGTGYKGTRGTLGVQGIGYKEEPGIQLTATAVTLTKPCGLHDMLMPSPQYVLLRPMPSVVITPKSLLRGADVRCGGVGAAARATAVGRHRHGTRHRQARNAAAGNQGHRTT